MIGTQSNAASFSAIHRRNGDGSWGNFPDLQLNPVYGRHQNKWGTQPTLLYIWTYPLS